jgi:hypothetical protein
MRSLTQLCKNMFQSIKSIKNNDTRYDTNLFNNKHCTPNIHVISTTTKNKAQSCINKKYSGIEI